ncbi:MAG: hypothetical protein IT508_11760 [Burkholderiaceae bacterium]|nr:hypothetical protein [Burkholderiaceae bacterium]
MKLPSFLPKELCGVAAAPLPLPALFAQDMQRHGHAVDAPVLHDIGGHRHSLADELRGATGFQFEWGLLVAGFPDWYDLADYPPGCAWRIVPTALWERALRQQALPQPIHQLVLRLYADGHDALWPRFPAWIEAEPGLTYDVCVACVQSPHDAARLFEWVEREFLARVLPPVLRLMEADLLQTRKRPVSTALHSSVG